MSTNGKTLKFRAVKLKGFTVSMNNSNYMSNRNRCKDIGTFL